MKDSYCRAEAVDKGPISLAIRSKSVLPFLKQFENGIGAAAELKLLGKRVLGEVYSRLIGIVTHGIDDQLQGRRRSCHSRLSDRRHTDNQSFFRLERKACRGLGVRIDERSRAGHVGMMCSRKRTTTAPGGEEEQPAEQAAED
jgi:hypothetical protein